MHSIARQKLLAGLINNISFVCIFQIHLFTLFIVLYFLAGMTAVFAVQCVDYNYQDIVLKSLKWYQSIKKDVFLRRKTYFRYLHGPLLANNALIVTTPWFLEHAMGEHATCCPVNVVPHWLDSSRHASAGLELCQIQSSVCRLYRVDKTETLLFEG